MSRRAPAAVVLLALLDCRRAHVKPLDPPRVTLRPDCVALKPMGVMGGEGRIPPAGAEPPVLIHRENPRVPGVKGIVIIQTIVDDQGKVCDAAVLQGIDPRTDAAALAAVRKWNFRPATWKGVPRASYFAVSVSF